MKFLGKKYLIFYTIISIFLFLVLSPFSNIRMDKLLASLTEQLIIQEVNPVREDHGFLDLEVNDKLTKAAQLKAEDMVKRNYFDHNGPNGEKPWTWLEKVDYDYAAAGENLAMNFNDPVELINAWLNSPLHAKNILNGYFTDIGIGIADDIVVMFLGREKTESLALASNITSEYEEIVASEVKSSGKPQRFIIEETENVEPENPVIVKTVDENELYKGNLILSAIDEGKGKLISTDSDVTVFQVFLLNDAPELFRAFLTILFSGILILSILGVVIKNERESAIILPSIYLLVLTTLLWLPEVLI